MCIRDSVQVGCATGGGDVAEGADAGGSAQRYRAGAEPCQIGVGAHDLTGAGGDRQVAGSVDAVGDVVGATVVDLEVHIARGGERDRA